MKKTLFAAIVMAVATMPLTFGAQATKAASPAGSNTTANAAPVSKTPSKANKATKNPKGSGTHKKSTKAPAATPSK